MLLSVYAMLAIDLLVVAVLVLVLFVRYIPNSRVGIVEKRFSRAGSVERGLIALNGEAGFQPEVLRGGLHWINRIQYRVHSVPLVTIAQGRIGYVFARDGLPLQRGQTLAANVRATDVLDVRAFLAHGGQSGPQRMILREGTFAVNLAQFVVMTEDRLYCLPLEKDDLALFQKMTQTIHERGGFRPVVIRDADDLVGIVTVHDGPALPEGSIIAPTVGDDPVDDAGFHNSFQDPDRFLAAGGHRGRQLQVLVEGTYFLNRLFATVELVQKTLIDVGHVGVVVSYTGHAGGDLSGREFLHGELVAPGCRGVWSEPLLPGKYAFNPYAGRVLQVPTTNFILKWNRREMGSHRFDENLSEVQLVTRDAFEPSLPLSVVVHIDYRKAPLVVQRFGDIKRLVEQTLDPMVAAYFKNVGQTRTLLELLQDRAEIQRVAGEQMRAKFAHYNLELEEVLIGTPSGAAGDTHIDTILAQLRQRQVAEEQIETYARQQRAAVKEIELREAEARAAQQRNITESQLAIEIHANAGRAEYQRAVQQAAQMTTLAEAKAQQVRLLADADAARIRAVGHAEAEQKARVGIGEAIAIEEQVRAYGGPRYQLTQQVMDRVARAIAEAKVDVVPRVVMGAQGDGAGHGNVLETLLAMLLSEKLAVSDGAAGAPVRTAEVEQIRKSLTAPAPSTG